MASKLKIDRSSRGDCLFFSALLGIVIVMCCLFIIGVPKFVIGLEHLHSCPEAPLVPVYVCVTGLLGVVCVGHSLFLWTCLYRKHMKKKTTHSCCLCIWAVLMLSVPVIQLAGSPYIIKSYQNIQTKQEVCRSNGTNSSLVLPQNSSISGGYTVLSTQSVPVNIISNITNPSYTSFPVIPEVTAEQGVGSRCEYCNDVVLTCAYVTIMFELVVLTLPMICLVIAAIVFRLRSKIPET